MKTINAGDWALARLWLTDPPVLSPWRVHGRRERKFYLNTGITYGFHHGWGSWRERGTWTYLSRKLAKWFGRSPRRASATEPATATRDPGREPLR
jgi:hypothetical protein